MFFHKTIPITHCQTPLLGGVGVGLLQMKCRIISVQVAASQFHLPIIFSGRILNIIELRKKGCFIIKIMMCFKSFYRLWTDRYGLKKLTQSFSHAINQSSFFGRILPHLLENCRLD